MKRLNCGLTGLGLALAASIAAGARRPVGGEGNGYTFQTAPVNSLGIKGLADLRGKPVLIDFWGTH